MSDNPDEVANRLGTAATASFNEFETALIRSGVDATRGWGVVKQHAAALDGLSRQVASGIRNLQEDDTISDTERRARIADINSTFDGLSRTMEKDLRGAVTAVEDSLVDAQRVLPDSDPFQRSLIRNEIDQLVNGYPASTPEKPGKPMLVKLQEIAQMNPAYAAEIADPLGIGRVKMTAAGEGGFTGALYRNTIELAGAGTPKALAAKNARAEMTRLKVAGQVTGAYHAAKFRVAAANVPKPVVGRPAWQPDTMRYRP